MKAEDILKMFPPKPDGDAIELFHSYESMKELEGAVGMYNGSERAVATLIMMQTILTIRNIISRNIEKNDQKKTLLKVTDWHKGEVRIEICGNGTYMMNTDHEELQKWFEKNAGRVASEIMRNLESN